MGSSAVASSTASPLSPLPPLPQATASIEIITSRAKVRTGRRDMDMRSPDGSGRRGVGGAGGGWDTDTVVRVEQVHMATVETHLLGGGRGEVMSSGHPGDQLVVGTDIEPHQLVSAQQFHGGDLRIQRQF